MRDARQLGAAILGCLLVATGGVCLLVLHNSDHPVDAAQVMGTVVAIVVPVACGLAALKRGAWPRRAPGTVCPDVAGTDRRFLDRAAASLAAAVLKQLDVPARPRTLLARSSARMRPHPEPIRVRWEYGPADLVPNEIPTPGRQTVRRRRSDLVDDVSADDVTGLRRTVFEPLMASGGRPLLLLGEAGAGKTAAMILLMRDLLEHPSDPASPVPVWLSLGDWDAATTPFLEWAVGEMVRTFPALRTAEVGGEATVMDLLTARRLIFFLDGLDEMPRDQRRDALNRLHDEMRGRPMVISSRVQEYRRALNHGRLDGAVPVHLKPVETTDAVDYLLGGQITGRLPTWRGLTDAIRSDPLSPVAQALTSPLALGLIRDAYHHGDPAELLDQDRFRTDREVMTHLMDRFLLEAYGSKRRAAAHRRRLARIAAELGRRRTIHWWQVVRWVPQGPLQQVVRCTAALSFALCIGTTAALSVSAGIGLTSALIAVIVALGGSPKQASIRDPNHPVKRIVVRALSPRELFDALSAALLAGSLAFTEIRRVPELPPDGDWRPAPWIAGVAVGLGWAWLVALRQWAVPNDQNSRATPRSTYRDEWILSGTRAVTIGGLLGLVVLTVGGGPLLALTIVIGGALAHWVEYTSIASVWLADTYLRVRDRSRTGLMRLLTDAHARQVLRQVGDAYQFRHVEIQDFLAREHLDRRPTTAG